MSGIGDATFDKTSRSDHRCLTGTTTVPKAADKPAPAKETTPEKAPTQAGGEGNDQGEGRRHHEKAKETTADTKQKTNGSHRRYQGKGEGRHG